MNYGYSKNDVINYLHEYKHQISHLIVLHTDVRPLKAYGERISQDTLIKVSKRVGWFRNRLNKRLYGHKNNMVFIPTVEGIQDIGDSSLTTHLNVALSTPDWVQNDTEFKNIVEECWLKAGGVNVFAQKQPKALRDEQIFVQRAGSAADVERWISYINKEHGSWDVINTQLPPLH